jgi:hypothetical protein
MSQPKLLKVNQQMINPEAVVGLRWQEPELPDQEPEILIVFLQGGFEFQFKGEEAKKVWEYFKPFVNKDLLKNQENKPFHVSEVQWGH